jgi:hypothetical protein
MDGSGPHCYIRLLPEPPTRSVVGSTHLYSVAMKPRWTERAAVGAVLCALP